MRLQRPLHRYCRWSVWVGSSSEIFEQPQQTSSQDVGSTSSRTPLHGCSLGFQLFGSPCRICVKQKQVRKEFYIWHAKRGSWTGSELRNSRAWSMKTVLASLGPTYVPFASLLFQGRTSVTSRRLTCFWRHYTTTLEQAAFKAMRGGQNFLVNICQLSTEIWTIGLQLYVCAHAFPRMGLIQSGIVKNEVRPILLCIVHWHFKSVVSGARVCTVGCVHFGNRVPGTIACTAPANA